MKVDKRNDCYWLASRVAAMDAAEKGEDLYGPYGSVSDLMEALNA